MLTFFQLNCDAADCVASGLDFGLSADHVVCIDNSVDDCFDDNSVDDDNCFNDDSVYNSVYDNSVYDDSVYDDSVERVKQF
jgi:hypothetical protein